MASYVALDYRTIIVVVLLGVSLTLSAIFRYCSSFVGFPFYGMFVWQSFLPCNNPSMKNLARQSEVRWNFVEVV